MKLTSQQLAIIDQNHAGMDEFLNETRADVARGLAGLGMTTEAVALIEGQIAATLDVSCTIMAAQAQSGPWTNPAEVLSMLLARVLVTQEIEKNK